LHCLQYGEHEIRHEIVRRPRKTLEITVEPDESVATAALEDATLDPIAAKLRKRATWVTGQKRFFSQFLLRTPQYIFVAGETHPYLSRQARRKVVLHVRESVKLSRGFTVVQTHRPTKPVRPGMHHVSASFLMTWVRSAAK
jgi:hypothetical protein